MKSECCSPRNDPNLRRREWSRNRLKPGPGEWVGVDLKCGECSGEGTSPNACEWKSSYQPNEDGPSCDLIDRTQVTKRYCFHLLDHALMSKTRSNSHCTQDSSEGSKQGPPAVRLTTPAKNVNQCKNAQPREEGPDASPGQRKEDAASADGEANHPGYPSISPILQSKAQCWPSRQIKKTCQVIRINKGKFCLESSSGICQCIAKAEKSNKQTGDGESRNNSGSDSPRIYDQRNRENYASTRKGFAELAGCCREIERQGPRSWVKAERLQSALQHFGGRWRQNAQEKRGKGNQLEGDDRTYSY